MTLGFRAQNFTGLYGLANVERLGSIEFRAVGILEC